MCTASRSFFCIVVLATAGWLMTSEAWAHRDRGPDDPCRRQLGASLLHLTLYQPQFDPDGEYCDEVPREGKTVVVVDVTAGELREVPMSLEVVAAGDSGQPRTILSVPPKVYQRGVVDTEVILNEGSNYVARVVLELGAGREPQLLSFPIRVAAWYRAMLMPVLIVAALLVLTTISVIRYYVSSRQDESLAGMEVHRAGMEVHRVVD
jgi:hypothetical protein